MPQLKYERGDQHSLLMYHPPLKSRQFLIAKLVRRDGL